VGNPLERETQVGPLARADLRDSLHRQVQESIKRGAKLVLGGQILDGKGRSIADPAHRRGERHAGLRRRDFRPRCRRRPRKGRDDAVPARQCLALRSRRLDLDADRDRGERLAAQIEPARCSSMAS